MKKITALFLILIMMLSMIGCAIPGLGSDTSTDTESDTSRDSTQQTVPPTYKPTLVPDRTKYDAITSSDGKFITYAGAQYTAPALSRYYNGYKSALSMTFDDGYDAGTARIISEQFAKYNWRGTAMIQASNMINGKDSEGNYIPKAGIVDAWNAAFATGHVDVGVHGFNHTNPLDISAADTATLEREIVESKEVFRQLFPTQRVLTFATPFAQITKHYEEELREHYISNRLENGGNTVTPGNNNNLYRVRAISVNQRAELTSIMSEITSGVSRGSWIVELYHCILEKPVNGTDYAEDKFISHCEYLYDKYKDEVWFASFEDVSIYTIQYENAKFEYTSADRESMVFHLDVNDELDTSIYNFPMTATITVPHFTDSAYAVVNGEEVYLEIIGTKTGEKAVVINDIEYRDQDIVIYLGGNKTYKNNCVHNFSEENVVTSNCTEFGYTEKVCVKCEHSYKLAFTDRHDFTGEGEVITEPTEESEGLERVKCKNCNEHKDIVIPKKEAEQEE